MEGWMSRRACFHPSTLPYFRTSKPPHLPILAKELATEAEKLHLGLLRLELRREEPALGLDELLLHLAELDAGDGAHLKLLQRHVYVGLHGVAILSLKGHKPEAIPVPLVGARELGGEAGAHVLDGKTGVGGPDLGVLRAAPASPPNSRAPTSGTGIASGL